MIDRKMLAWWQRGVIYQIYPRSFQDSDGDGIGDLPGIRRRLPYLQWLGVDAVWISPIYPSPQADFGYDVADYCAIDPDFGRLEDFDRLVEDVHRHDMRLILDFVPNHTSIAHPWFEESRRSRESAKRDWYIWRDPAPDGGPPNNWVSNFGGSAWTWDEQSGQYYYHAFLEEQPDLNWRNREVRAAMYDVLRFWLRRGVDGFRVDVMWHLIKDEQFRDDPPNPGYREGDPDIRRVIQIHSADQPEVHDVVREMRAVLEEFEDRLLIGEIYLPLERLVHYYGEDLSGAHLPFNFQLIRAAWNTRTIADLIREYEAALPEGGWPNWVLGNHDQKRIATRVGSDQARVAAVLLLTLRGTPTLYYGDELGMCDVSVPRGQVRDAWAANEPGLGVGRDPQRTPMQWSQEPHAGFSSARPWLPVADDFTETNVAVQREAASSMLSFYRKLIELRRSRDALIQGSLTLHEADEEVLAFERRAGEERILVYLNLGEEERSVPLPPGCDKVRILISTHEHDGEAAGKLRLAPHEAVIAEPA